MQIAWSIMVPAGDEKHGEQKNLPETRVPGFEPGTSSLPSCDESRASPVFRHYLLRTNSYIIITEWF